MKKIHTQKGFTLVELAIVMTIIGLLIGGILKGQELMENARVTATVAQIKAYEAAVTTFRDMYSAVPGDMTNAENRIPGCNTQCTALAGNGDSAVGDTGWGTALYVAQDDDSDAEERETLTFWTHLLLANLITGVTDTTISASPVLAWGESHPAARIGGGFVVGFGDGEPGPGAPATVTSGPSGMILALVNGISTDPGVTAGQQPLSAGRAAQIDRRVDDGRPGTGYVQTYGTATSCFGDDPDAPGTVAPVYLESSVSRDCGLFFRIQG